MPRTLSKRSATGSRAITNGEIGPSVSLLSVWSGVLVDTMLAVLTGISEWSSVGVAGINVGGKSV